MRKAIVCLALILSCFMLTACEGDLRKSPYSAKEMEEYLEAEYNTDLVILTRTEVYDPYFETLGKVEYEVGYAKDYEDAEWDGMEETFQVIDIHDGGMAGWNVGIY